MPEKKELSKKEIIIIIIAAIVIIAIGVAVFLIFFNLIFINHKLESKS